jgi:hypothetical protein
METKIFYVFIITLIECYLVYSNISTGYPISGRYPIGTGTVTVSRPIGLVGMDICKSLGYNFRSGIIIPEQNPTRCHPYLEGLISWTNNLSIPPKENWIIIGDFNLYRFVQDRNRSGQTSMI